VREWRLIADPAPNEVRDQPKSIPVTFETQAMKGKRPANSPQCVRSAQDFDPASASGRQ